MAIHFDTLKATRILEEAGIDRRQAEAPAQCLAEAVTLSRDDLVTKADLAQAVNRMLLAQIAIAGLLFGAIKLF